MARYTAHQGRATRVLWTRPVIGRERRTRPCESLERRVVEERARWESARREGFESNPAGRRLLVEMGSKTRISCTLENDSLELWEGDAGGRKFGVHGVRERWDGGRQQGTVGKSFPGGRHTIGIGQGSETIRKGWMEREHAEWAALVHEMRDIGERISRRMEASCGEEARERFGGARLELGSGMARRRSESTTAFQVWQQFVVLGRRRIWVQRRMPGTTGIEKTKLLWQHEAPSAGLACDAPGLGTPSNRIPKGDAI
ncbi:hypothetical protein B0H13DRAFT_1894990 [Mycena leptocephala]|nr:hypothetical protein B0H13DRAFT_1894990 [Mycena leptocephala]